MRTTELKPVPRFPGICVSNNGHVYQNDIELRQTIISKGRPAVHINKSPIVVARLVAEAWIPNPANWPFVRHLDDNPVNNSVENLSWGGREDNAEDSKRNGTFAIGTRHGRSKLTDDKVRAIRALQGKKTMTQIAADFNVSLGCIQRVMDRRTWAHV